MSRLLLPLTLAACLPEVDRDQMDRVADLLEPGSSMLTGHLPSVDEFQRDITLNELEISDRNRVDVALHGLQDDWIMLAGTVDLHPDELPEGEWVRLDQTQHSLYACSGPDEAVVYYERSANAVLVRKHTHQVGDAGQPELSIVAAFGTDGTVGAIAAFPSDDRHEASRD